MLDEMRRGVHPKSPNPYYIRFDEGGNLRGTRRMGVSRGRNEETKNEEIDTSQENTERNRREKIATKSDDACVPEYLGAEHLITDFSLTTKDGSVRVWKEDKVKNLPGVMRALQKVAFLF